MKIEMDIKWAIILQVMIIAIMIFYLGNIVAFYGFPKNSNEKITSCNSTDANCLTSADLNRSDIGTSIILSRFCEGMGLKSNVVPAVIKDGQLVFLIQDTNVFGLPICLKNA